MYYVEQIRYAGKPSKVVLPEGGYLFTLVAKDVPVTHVLVAETLGLFTWNMRTFQQQDPVSKKCVLKFIPNGLQTKRFIGEQTIIFETLFQMFMNSYEAGATRFMVEVLEDSTHIFFVVTDDGDGVHASVEREFMKRPLTTKRDGLGCDIFLAASRLEKIGAVLSFEGKASMSDTDKPGAKFRISFFKEMPKAT
jgi:hypothetical protein